MKKQFSTIGILMAFLVLGGLFLGCSNGTEQSTNTIKVTVQNDSGYKLYSVRAGGVEIGDIEIGTTQRKDIEPDELSYSVFFTIKLTSTNVNIRTIESKAYNSDVTVIIENTTIVTLTTGEQSVKALSQLISDIQNSGNNGNDNDDDNNNNGNDNDDNDNNDGLTLGTLPEGTLAHKFNFIASQPASNVLYDIVIDSDIVYEAEMGGGGYIKTNGQNVTVHIHSASADDIKTISIVNKDNIFVPWGNNIHLKLSNIILTGISNNGYALVFAGNGATLTIDEGTIIRGNNNTAVGSASAGSAVYIQDSNLIMNDGEISGNKGDQAIGIMIRHSSFIMNGGKISGNHASTLGGGVVLWDGSFIMNAGEISNNNAGNGGGVLINQTGTFTMNGGVIKGNTAGDTGGGIYALDRTLTQNGGGSRITVSITGGEIIGNSAKYGGGIALYNSRLTKTGGYIAGTDSGINANVSTQNQGDAILYCRDTTFWDRKLSLTQSDNISTDNMNNGWTYLGVEGSF